MHYTFNIDFALYIQSESTKVLGFFIFFFFKCHVLFLVTSRLFASIYLSVLQHGLYSSVIIQVAKRSGEGMKGLKEQPTLKSLASVFPGGMFSSEPFLYAVF